MERPCQKQLNSLLCNPIIGSKLQLSYILNLGSYYWILYPTILIIVNLKIGSQDPKWFLKFTLKTNGLLEPSFGFLVPNLDLGEKYFQQCWQTMYGVPVHKQRRSSKLKYTQGKISNNCVRVIHCLLQYLLQFTLNRFMYDYFSGK